MSLRRIPAAIPLALAFLLLWQGLIMMTCLPPFLLPGPRAVLAALHSHPQLLAQATLRSATEMIAGFALGGIAGAGLAVLMALCPRIATALRQLLLISQVIPIFAMAPILTLWLGYGIAPKIVVTALICFFPVASAFLNGLERCSPACLDLAQSMGASRLRTMWHLRIPMALPMLGSGLTLAAAYAPVGAVIGEWVGGSEGLGAVMIHANGRMRIDLTFAALALVTLLALSFHGTVNWILRRALARFA